MSETSTAPLVVLLKQLADRMVGELVARLRAAGYTDITIAHHPVFYNIDREGTRITDLAARAGMTHQSMSELVGALVDLGYLERVPDPADGRARLARPTRRGHAAIRRARTEIADIESAWLDAFRRAGLDLDLRPVLAAALRDPEPRT
ncbi:MarR family transcriptional regulator [Nocardia sp. 2]|uniref:MarR family transcriptional regulator n=1 Tax=Nocardia acididurans TaxID=2802282 RepID=A0ABS1M8V8_9NOCA|nr:MarR family transcriptional regulator [Nocardia acididurans]MBL1077073.1 MarR family transcriptional regulator [Nocardia acididurans]